MIELRVVDGRGLDQRRILEGVLLPDTVQHAVIKDTVAAADSRFAISKDIVSKAEPGSEVFLRVRIDMASIRRAGHPRSNGLRLCASCSCGEDQAVHISSRDLAASKVAADWIDSRCCARIEDGRVEVIECIQDIAGRGEVAVTQP